MLSVMILPYLKSLQYFSIKRGETIHIKMNSDQYYLKYQTSPFGSIPISIDIENIPIFYIGTVYKTAPSVLITVPNANRSIH
jgi:hypothetical protein